MTVPHALTGLPTTAAVVVAVPRMLVASEIAAARRVLFPGGTVMPWHWRGSGGADAASRADQAAQQLEHCAERLAEYTELVFQAIHQM